MEILMSDKIKKDILTELKKALKYHPEGVTSPALHKLVFENKYHQISVYKALSEMEETGLIKSNPGRSLRGRPTKLYTLNGERVMYIVQKEIRFPRDIALAVKKWDQEFPTTPKSIRSRHLMIAHCLDILSSECKITMPQQASIIQARHLYDYAIKEGGCSHSGASNKVRCMRKLLYYLGVEDNKNPFHLALKPQKPAKSPIVKRASIGRKTVIKDSGHTSNHVLEEVLAGIQVMGKEPGYEQGVSPSDLHRELFFKNWDISHTYRACQRLQTQGLLKSTFGKMNNKVRKFYLPTGKRFFQAQADQQNKVAYDTPMPPDQASLLDQVIPLLRKRAEPTSISETVSGQVSQAVSALNWLADRVVQLETELDAVRKELSRATAQARRAMIQYGD